MGSVARKLSRRVNALLVEIVPRSGPMEKLVRKYRCEHHSIAFGREAHFFKQRERSVRGAIKFLRLKGILEDQNETPGLGPPESDPRVDPLTFGTSAEKRHAGGNSQKCAGPGVSESAIWGEPARCETKLVTWIVCALTMAQNENLKRSLSPWKGNQRGLDSATNRAPTSRENIIFASFVISCLKHSP